MASVHESLYFNPMMTNGVVHANVFGIKDWVTPYKISVLALLYDMAVSKISLPERRRLNKLILPLQQVSLSRCFCLHSSPGRRLTPLSAAPGSGPEFGSFPEHCGRMLPSDSICCEIEVIRHLD